MTPAPLALALIAGGRAGGLRASLAAYAEALDVVERAGHRTLPLLVDRTSTAEAEAVLREVEGAETVAVPPETPDLDVWRRALADAHTDHVILACTDARTRARRAARSVRNRPQRRRGHHPR